MPYHKTIYTLAISLSCALLLSACGGGGGSSTPNNNIPTAAVRINGTAATGAAIANATITIKGANGATATATTDSFGKYTSPDISGLTAPYLLRITKAAAGAVPAIDLYSVGNAAGTVNIHPLTDLIIKAWYEAKGTTVTAAFANPTTNAPPTTLEVTVIKQVLENMLSNWLVLAGVDPASFDLITTPFDADSADFDGFLDQVDVANGVINLNTDVDPAAEYQISLTGATTSGGTYSGLVKEDLLNDGFFTTTISTVTAPLAGATASTYEGAWSLVSIMTAGTSACGSILHAENTLLAQVDSYGNIYIYDPNSPAIISATGTISAAGVIEGTIYGDSLTSTSGCPTGSFTGTTTTSGGSGNYTQDAETGTFTLIPIIPSAYAGAWVLQGRLSSIASTGSQCGSTAANVGTIMATEAIIVGVDGSFLVMDQAYPGYPSLRGMINADGSFTLTAYGDSLILADGILGAGTCPASDVSSGSMSSENYGMGTLSQGGETWAVTLTRGTTDTVGAIVGSWFVTEANGKKEVLTFMANGEYVTAINGTTDTEGFTGIERGFYSWNALTGALTILGCPTVNTTGGWGLSNPTSCATFTETWTWIVNGNTLSWSSASYGDTGTFTRVAADAASPIVGSWAFATPDNGARGVITFLANGEYVHVEDGPTMGAGMSGMERGTYTWNASGVLTTPGCPAVDTNGEWGFSHPVGGSPCAASSQTMTVSGNTLTMNDPTAPIFTRVVP